MDLIWKRGGVSVRLTETSRGRPTGSVVVAGRRSAILKAIAIQLEDWGYRVQRRMNLEDIESAVDPENTEALVLCVESLAGHLMDAEKVRNAASAVPVVLVVATPHQTEATDALRRGFFDYVVLDEIQIIRRVVLGQPAKEDSPDPLQGALSRAVNHSRLMSYNQQLTSQLELANSALADEQRDLREALGQLRETQGQLLRVEKAAGLSIVCHGVGNAINNPLAVIGSNLDLLQRWYHRSSAEELEDPLTGEIKDIIEECVRGLARIETTVSSLMQFAHSSDVDIETCDLRSLLQNLPPYLDERWAADLFIECEGAPAILANSYLLRQALRCIINNASEATQATGRASDVSISVDREDANAVIRIEDRGDGIPCENRERVFDPFFTTRLGRNAEGLGLSIAHDIIHRMGGTIEIDSVLGAGTVVAVKLPRDPAELQPSV